MLEVKNVSFRVDTDNGPLDIIDDVSFTLEKGKFLVVTGPNGGGKSTLLRIALGLLAPDRGEVRLFGGPPTATRGRAGAGGCARGVRGARRGRRVLPPGDLRPRRRAPGRAAFPRRGESAARGPAAGFPDPVRAIAESPSSFAGRRRSS